MNEFFFQISWISRSSSQRKIVMAKISADEVAHSAQIKEVKNT